MKNGRPVQIHRESFLSNNAGVQFGQPFSPSLASGSAGFDARILDRIDEMNR